MQSCVHSSAKRVYFEVPYLGNVSVCVPCRRILALRTIERPRALAPLDFGRIGYGCAKCGGDFTSTFPGNCRCPGRREECAANLAATEQLVAYLELVNRHA